MTALADAQRGKERGPERPTLLQSNEKSKQPFQFSTVQERPAAESSLCSFFAQAAKQFKQKGGSRSMQRSTQRNLSCMYFCQARLQVPPDQRQNMQSSLQLLKMFVYSTSSRTSWMPERTSWRLLVINIFPPKKPRAAVTGSMATKKTLGLLASA